MGIYTVTNTVSLYLVAQQIGPCWLRINALLPLADNQMTSSTSHSHLIHPSTVTFI